MSYYTGDEWRWRLRSSSYVPTITVSDLSDEAKSEREERIKRGARIVPFGFARAIPVVERDPLLWEGSD